MIGYDCSRAPTLRERTVVSAREEPGRSELSEAEAVRCAQHGDAVAFKQLYQLHSRRIYTLFLRMVANPTEAEDLTQEAFLRVFRKISTFRGESAFSTWLHRVALNVALMHLRRKSLVETSLDEMTAPDADRGEPGKEVGGPDLSLTWLVDRVNLERAVAQLPPTCRMVFVLHDIQGFKHREIAGMMGWSVGTSKVQLHRAHRRLRDLLRETLASGSVISKAIGQNNQCAPLY